MDAFDSDAVESLITGLREQTAGEIRRLQDALVTERIRANRLESECRNLWAAYSLARSAAESATTQVSIYHGVDNCENEVNLLQRADKQLGIIELEIS